MRRQSRCPSLVGVRFVRRTGGFTLIETMVVLAIVALVSSAVIPVVTRPYIAERQVEAMHEMAAIHTAISGRPEDGQYGFIGDIGALGGTTDPLSELAASNTPANPGLNALLQAGSLSVATVGDATASAPGVIVGWNGPYLRPRLPDPLIDPWGNPYRLLRDTTDSSLWKIQSIGPDRIIGTDDDLFLPDSSAGAYFQSKGVVTVELMKANDFAQWSFTSTELINYSVGLGPTSTPPLTDCPRVANTNRFVCPKTWFGQHQIYVFYNGGSPAVAEKKIALASPQFVTQLVVPKAAANTGGTAIANPTSPCERVPMTWLFDPLYTPTLKATLASEGAFCATLPQVSKYQNLRVDFTGLITPSDDTTECAVSIKMTDDKNPGAWTVAGPVRIKGTPMAVPVSLSGSVIATKDSNDSTGWPITIYVRVEATGTGTCAGSPPTSPANASAGTVVAMGHP
jgi:prepilin-type N-terminal cleavage/methylation domain-containing protein